MSFIEADILHQTALLLILFFVTFIEILKVEQIPCYAFAIRKNAQTADVFDRFASTRLGPSREVALVYNPSLLLTVTHVANSRMLMLRRSQHVTCHVFCHVTNRH